jgi:glycosyltransferase involved in cell wall biosynthesis
VLSSFAYDSFVAEGFDPAKLRLLPLGVDTDTFRPTPDVIEARCQRILSGKPLQILYVGTVCLRKGIWDLAVIARHLKQKRFEFRLVGNVLPEVRHAVRDLRDFSVLVHRQPQHRLRDWYAASDLFLFPTLEEGYPAVLAQAGASGLPILTTPNGAGPHLVREGKTGWILPIRDPEAFIERLLWCDANRAVLAEMVQRIYDGLRARSWDDVAKDFEAVCVDEISPVAYRAVANG